MLLWCYFEYFRKFLPCTYFFWYGDQRNTLEMLSPPLKKSREKPWVSISETEEVYKNVAKTEGGTFVYMDTNGVV